MKVEHVLTRVYANDADAAVNFYENLFKRKCDSRFSYEEMGLEIAKVGGVLIVAGPASALEPFRETRATFLVDSVVQCKAWLLENGAEVLSDIKKVPTGFNMTVRHPDGMVAEYVEHADTAK